MRRAVAFAAALIAGAASVQAQTDSAAAVRRARAAETEFFVAWRRMWASNYHAQRYDLARLGALHCHFDGSYDVAIHVIRSAYSRRSMCPIWFPDSTIDADERGGVDYALSLANQSRARALRRDVIRVLDSVAAVIPADSFVTGQRVRFYLDQNEPANAAEVARGCRAAVAWCESLRGYVHWARAAWQAADSAFTRAAAAMSDDDRCAWTALTLLLPSDDRGEYRKRSCPERAKLDARFWWLADPLYSEPGNQRRVEHYARKVLVELHGALTIDERWDWVATNGGDAIAEMIVRYGWPSFVGWAGGREDVEHFGWLGFTDSSVNVSAEYIGPRAHTTPTLKEVVDSAGTFEDSDLGPALDTRGMSLGLRLGFDPGWWPVEHYARDGGSLIRLDHQRAMFRRAATDRLVVAMRIPPGRLTAGVRFPYTYSLVAMRGPEDEPHITKEGARLVAGATSILTADLPARATVVSAEVVPSDGQGPAARARFSVSPPPPLSAHRAGEIALSDLLLFTAPPRGVEAAATLDVVSQRMLPGTTLRGAERVGVFWEIYGVSPGDSLDVVLRVAQNQKPGFLRRLGARLGLADRGNASIDMTWREPQPGQTASRETIAGVHVQGRSVVFDVSRLAPGDYLLSLAVGRPGRAAATAERALTIAR